MNFIFIKITWRLVYLRWLNFAEKWFRGSTLKLHTKRLICFRMWQKIFPEKISVMDTGVPRITRTIFQLQFLWLIGCSWSLKITNCCKTVEGSHEMWMLCFQEIQRTFLWSETISNNWMSFKNDEKCFLFHVKRSFCSWDIYIVVLTFWLHRKKAW